MLARLRHGLLALSALLGLLFDVRQRRLFAEMRAFARQLPQVLAAPVPQALATLTFPTREADLRLPTSTVRRLADLTALLDHRSPFGLCLRRSLIRYHFLRRTGLPVEVRLGARFKAGQPDREVTGHAWVTLNGEPYFEEGENWQGFTVMLSFPAPE
jgi:hypothetical protein